MSFSAPLGFLVSVVVIYFAVTYGIPNSRIFFDPHAAVVVVGGTLAAALICFPMKHFFTLIKIYFRTVTGRTELATLDTINEIVSLSQQQNEGAPLEQLAQGKINNLFLKESLDLIVQGGLNDDELADVLEKRVELQNERYRREGNTYKIIGKFPPAFGLVGTTLGMISLLQSLGSPNAFERIGPSMSIALVATFYGLILSNVIITVGENLIQSSETDLIRRRIVVDGVRLLKEKKHPLLVEEHLKSYLSPNERNKMKRTAA